MRNFILVTTCVLTLTGIASAQRHKDRLGKSLLKPGDSGIAWYTTWDTGLAEAKRSGRPIMFMTAATQCSGVPGVY